jgi:hypothetical protein
MPGLSFNVLRVGKKYRLVNFRDEHEFIIQEILENGNFKLKDLNTLEIMFMKDLIYFGKGKDFEISELGGSFDKA